MPRTEGRDGKERPAARPGAQGSAPTGPDPDNNLEDRKVRGKGIFLANEAINDLSRIAKNDALRERGFQLVMDGIRRNR